MKKKSVIIFAIFFVFSFSRGICLETFDFSRSEDDTLNTKEQVSGNPSSLTLNFDSLADFTLNFAPWSTVDGGGGLTYSITGILFPHEGEPMAYICFNPEASTPPEPYMKPHSGKKLGCCFSSQPPHNPNNKWLISPKMSLAADPKIEFWVQTYNPNYGMESFNVGVSTTDSNPNSFTRVNTTVESAPSTWTLKTYLLNQYANKDVFIGIQCVSDDKFILMIDDISITSVVGIDDKDTSGDFTIYPNPAVDKLSVRFDRFTDKNVTLLLMSTLGRQLREMTGKAGTDPLTLDVGGLSPGVYYLKVTEGNDDFIRKICIMNTTY